MRMILAGFALAGNRRRLGVVERNSSPSWGQCLDGDHRFTIGGTITLKVGP